MTREGTDPPAPSDFIGRRIGAYEVRAFLGAGGMGEVYRAHDVRLHRDVAIKFVSTSFAADVVRMARFEREAQILASLNHPHIAAVYGLEECAGVRALILELVDGETLHARLKRGPLPLDEALRLAHQLGEALGSAHAAGVVHRDIKPANILISRDGRAKIIDFGIAALVEPEARAGADTTLGLTTPGELVGTARYMSPEQILGLPADASSDVFSLGLVIYETVTGHHAFAGGDRPATTHPAVGTTVSKHVLGRISSPALRGILAKALALDSAERYPTAGELAEALQHLIAAGGASSRRTWSLVIKRAVAAGALLASATWLVATRPGLLPANHSDALVRVAVLPFENLSRDTTDNWLSGAFSDSLTLGLRSLGNVVLVDRDRVIEFFTEADLAEGGAIDIEAIDPARRLGVQQYVHGAFQRVDGNIRVTARLIDSASGLIRTQASVTGPIGDLFELEDELARRFAATFGAGARLAGQKPQLGLDAYQRALEGKRLYALGQYSEAADSFQAAVRLEPRSAEAWALLAKTTARLAAPASITTTGTADYRQRAVRAAERAVQLAPSMYEAHLAVALASREVGRLGEWRAASRRAIQINPRIAEAHALLADSYSAIPTWGCVRDRDAAEAEQHYREALRLDPYWYAAYTSLMTELQWTGRLEDALRLSDDALRAVPGNRAVRTYRGILLSLLNRQEEGELELIAAIPENSTSLLDQLFLGGLDLQRGDESAAARRFGAVLKARSAPVTLLLIAYAYVESGHFDGAVPFIATALEQDRTCASFVSRSPIWTHSEANAGIHALLSRYAAVQ